MLCVLLHIISIIQWFWNRIWEKNSPEKCRNLFLNYTQMWNLTISQKKEDCRQTFRCFMKSDNTYTIDIIPQLLSFLSAISIFSHRLYVCVFYFFVFFYLNELKHIISPTTDLMLRHILSHSFGSSCDSRSHCEQDKWSAFSSSAVKGSGSL